MINSKFLQKLFFLLLIGASMCALQACDEEENEKIEENNIENKREPLTLFKRWYLTDYSSNFLDLDWRTDKVVSWREYKEFSKDNTLYWNSRMGNGNTTYKLSGISSGNLTATTFSAVNISDSEDNRVFEIESLTEKYLLLYDRYENLYRGFVASDYAKFSDNNENNGSDSDDNEEEEEEEEEESYRRCGVCHGSGKCMKCGGDGGSYTYGGDGWNECEYCDESGACYVCDGTGWREKD